MVKQLMLKHALGIRLRRDNGVSVRYAEELNSEAYSIVKTKKSEN